MSATSGHAAGRERGRRLPRIRSEDPRTLRSRAAVVHAARALFLSKGYAGTTMEEIAARAGLTKRTVYNNYADKDALFTQIVTEITDYAAEFARDLRAELTLGITAANLRGTLDDLGRRLALGIVRPDVVALRRLLIGEARAFPALARRYYERAPGQVLDALAAGFEHLGRAGLLQVPDARRAAVQFAYLVAGEPLDRAMLAGTMPDRRHVVASAREGVETFLARYASAHRGLAVVRSPDPARPGRSRPSSRNRPSS